MKRSPVSCIPSPESPAKRITTRSSVWTVLLLTVHPGLSAKGRWLLCLGVCRGRSVSIVRRRTGVFTAVHEVSTGLSGPRRGRAPRGPAGGRIDSGAYDELRGSAKCGSVLWRGAGSRCLFGPHSGSGLATLVSPWSSERRVVALAVVAGLASVGVGRVGEEEVPDLAEHEGRPGGVRAGGWRSMPYRPPWSAVPGACGRWRNSCSAHVVGPGKAGEGVFEGELDTRCTARSLQQFVPPAWHRAGGPAWVGGSSNPVRWSGPESPGALGVSRALRGSGPAEREDQGAPGRRRGQWCGPGRWGRSR